MSTADDDSPSTLAPLLHALTAKVDALDKQLRQQGESDLAHDLTPAAASPSTTSPLHVAQRPSMVSIDI